jgi:hypothetical protein
MTGIGMASASGAGAGAAAPLNANLSFSGTTFNVTGASGSLGTYGGSITTSATGGVPPYSFSTSAQQDAGTGSVAVSGSTVNYSGMTVGGTILFHLVTTCTDNVGTTQGVRYPPGATTIAVNRTS